MSYHDLLAAAAADAAAAAATEVEDGLPGGIEAEAAECGEFDDTRESMEAAEVGADAEDGCGSAGSDDEELSITTI
jgi:hypothetical protein